MRKLGRREREKDGYKKRGEDGTSMFTKQREADDGTRKKEMNKERERDGRKRDEEMERKWKRESNNIL